MDADVKWRQDVLRRMDILISLALERGGDNKVSTTEKIVKLTELGLPPSEVARILGKSINYVTGAISMRKRSEMRAHERPDS